MFFILSKVLGFFAIPSNLMLVLALLGGFTTRSRPVRFSLSIQAETSAGSSVQICRMVGRPA